jgi:hypothetical protein
MKPEEQARNEHCEAILARMESWGEQYKGKGSQNFQDNINSAFTAAQNQQGKYAGRILESQDTTIPFTRTEELELIAAQRTFRNAVDKAVSFPDSGDKAILPELTTTVNALNALKGKDKQDPIVIKESPLTRLMNSMKAKINPTQSNGPSGPKV